MANEEEVQSPTAPVLDYATPAPKKMHTSLFATLSLVLGFLALVLVAFGSDFSTRGIHPAFGALCLLVSASGLFFGVRASRVARTAGRRRPLRSLAGIILAVGILLSTPPYIAGYFMPYVDPHERCYQAECQSNLQQIGQAITLYANTHGGLFPARFDQLITEQNVNVSTFVCPASRDDKAVGATTREVLTAFNKPGCCSYVYLGAGLTSQSVTSMTIIAYERNTNHEDASINIVLGNGTVQHLEEKEGVRVIAELQASHNPPRPATQFSR